MKKVSRITTKKGTLLNRAALSLVTHFYLNQIDRGKFTYSKRFDKGESAWGVPFDNVIQQAIEIDTLIVKPDHFNKYGFIDCYEKHMLDVFNSLGWVDPVIKIIIFTEPLENIRALVKHLRSDKAVAKVTKIPEKPREGIKTRKDVL